MRRIPSDRRRITGLTRRPGTLAVPGAVWNASRDRLVVNGERGPRAGGVVGLIFPPALVAGAVVGGGAGGIWGKIRDKGFKDDDLKAIGETMEPGTSAIIAVAEDHVIERLEKGLEGYSRISRHAVSSEAAVAITAEAAEA